MTDEFTAKESRRPEPEPNRSRRIILAAGVVGAAGAALGVPALLRQSTAAAAENPAAGALDLTPACIDDHDTPANIEGPFFKPKSPLRTNLVTGGVTGVLLTLTGRVFSERCQPISRALLEFWQADQLGDYDNEGFTLRGHQRTSTKGRYTLKTIVPKDYPGRTTHLHVKVQARNGPVLTTQLFFPDSLTAYGMNVPELNTNDDFIDRACTVRLGALADNHYSAQFDFVIKT